MPIDFDRCIDRRASESVKWNYYEEDVLPLWVADLDFRSPEPVIRALRERIDHGIFGYSMPPPGLREVIVENLQKQYNWQVSPQELVFLRGVVTGFNLVCHAMASPGEGVLIQTPVYFPILWAPVEAGLSNHEMVLTRRNDGYYEIDFDLFEDTITDQTRVFILCNPHNPVGRVFNRHELVRMAEICLRNNIIICSDEIHADLVFPGQKHIPIASLDPDIANQTVTLMSPSKTFNIPGLKFSVAIVSNPDLKEKLEKTLKGLIHGVNIFGYTAALAAYRHCQSWLDELMVYLDENIHFLHQYVEENMPGISMNKPEGTFLAWLNCKDTGISGNPNEFFLEKAKVALNDGETFGKGGENFVRLNFGCSRSTLKEALNRMSEALHSSR